MSEVSPYPEDGAAPKSKKRKRSEKFVNDLLNSSFVIKPYPANTFIKPRTLQPMILLPRVCLPLSYLDISSSARTLGYTRLFKAHAEILELEERVCSQPTVLIASSDGSKNLYVLERESRGLYAMCLLGPWIDLEHLQGLAVVSKSNDPKFSMPLDGLSPNLLPVTEKTSTSKISQRKRKAIESLQSMVRKSSLPEAHSTLQTSELKAPLINESLAVETQSVSQDRAENTPVHTAEEIFETVRKQYCEALYLSRSSLAYFAKGHLSRARAALHRNDYEDKIELKNYIVLLETLIMTISTIDKKYREVIPSLIDLIGAQDQSAKEIEKLGSKHKRKSEKKSRKRKNGLLPEEDALVRKWWGSLKETLDSEISRSTTDESFKACVSQLRIRETQLQMILILEILALLPLASVTNKSPEEMPKAPVSDNPKQIKKPVDSVKKSDHLTKLIDVHIDKLCIWQYVALDSSNITVQKCNKLPQSNDECVGRERPVENLLRDFCVEVIIPFFSSRLPDRCAVISRNLCGLTANSPPKPKLSKTNKSSTTPSRVDATTRRQLPATFNQSLKRALNDDRERRSTSCGPNKAIALMKSATMPMILGSKRDGAKIPISLDTSKIQLPKVDNCISNQLSINLKHRATNINRNQRVNGNKQTMIESELTDAISMLKKPNRQLVAKEFVDSAEKRLAGSLHLKESKISVKNQNSTTVQISATPKTHRNKKNPNPQRSEDNSEENDSYPACDTIQSCHDFPADYWNSTKKTLFSVQATPTRKPISKNLDFEHNNLSIDTNWFTLSPLSARRSSAQLFRRVTNNTDEDNSVTNEFSCEIRETPAKKRATVRDHLDSARSGKVHVDYPPVGITFN